MPPKRLLIIFGVSGDLFTGKLAPALARLYAHGKLEDTQILGISRKPWSDDDFRSFVLEKCHEASVEAPSDFLLSLTFMMGDIEDDVMYSSLFDEIGRQRQAGVQDVFVYLSVAPRLYEKVFTNLSDTNHDGIVDAHQWLRLIVEKPYGVDAVHAEQLDTILSRRFPKDHVFRIDHYLMKETMQDIFAFRFLNEIFKPIWNKEHIQDISVALHESVSIKRRAGFYDLVGALRDVGQNHALQMLAAVTMEEPAAFDAESIHSARNEIVKNLIVRPDIRLVRGQYQGYTAHEGVAANSQTETFFSIGAEIDTDRWRGVPIIIESGKALSTKETYIKVRFKKQISPVVSGDTTSAHHNEIVFSLYPHEGIKITVLGKKPGINAGIEEHSLSYSIQDHEYLPTADVAYEQVFYDALEKNSLLFASSSEIKHAWRFIDDVLQTWKDVPLLLYPIGSQPDTLVSE